MKDMTTAAQRRVLGLFAKLPLPGQVKTRLAAESSPEWAAQVARAFLLDVLERLAVVPARRVLGFAPPEAQDYFAAAARDRYLVCLQAAGDLGQRMAAFFAEQFRAGAEMVVLVGTDSPTLPLALVDQAFRELEQADVVLGPATDGGYYLIGCKKQVPPIFEGVAWGSDRVLGHTIARLTDLTWQLALLPPWYDVDTLADWRMLCGHLAALQRAGIDPALPHTLELAQQRVN